ncbi:MAG: hypothetical protein AAF678_09450 [Pseudomonadota bacterium]
MRNTIRKLFLGIGVIGLVVWYFVYKSFLRSACAADGIAPEACAFVLPWDLSSQQVSYMVIVPAFVVTIPFLLAFLVGGEPVRTNTPTQRDPSQKRAHADEE